MRILLAPRSPVRALIILVLGLLAAWLAAGSLGWLAPPLQRALTWLALAAIVIAALPGRRRISGSDGLLLGGATLIAVLMTASSLPVVNILAVAILLAAVAQVRPDRRRRSSGPAALAATALAVFRLVCDGSAAAWTFTNTVGHVEGLWAGWLTGRPLLIGASFGGLDFLVLMAALTAAWLIAAPATAHPPRRMGRAVHRPRADRISRRSGLQPRPDRSCCRKRCAKFDDVSHLGIWTWGNALRALLPWNLPLLAAVFQCVVAVGMFRLTAWHSDSPHDLQSGSGANSPPPRRAGVEVRSLQGGPAASARPAELGVETGGASGRQG